MTVAFRVPIVSSLFGSTLLGTIAALTMSFPALALDFTGINSGGTIDSGSQTFNLNLNNNSGSDVVINKVTITLASLSYSDLEYIELYLSSPTQTLTLKDLFTNNDQTTYTDVTFDDAAIIAIFDATSPITGSFQPEGFVLGDPPSGTSLTSTIPAFSGFNGSKLSTGTNTWTLSVFNTDEAGTAELGGVTLNVSASSSATPVPFETNASLGLLVLGGLYGGHRWLKSRSNAPLS